MHGPGGHTHAHDGHTHGHGGHDHGAGGHHHHVSAVGVSEPRWLWVALGLLAAVALIEVVAGVAAGSTALLSDAAHVVTDALAIGIALFAIRIAQRPAEGRYTYGLARVEILGAQANGATLLVLAGMLAVGAVIRLFDPPEVEGGVVVVVSIFGLIANVLAAWALAKANRQSLAVEGAYQHALMDAVSSVVAIIAGILIIAGVSSIVDPILALFVTAMMVRSGWSVLASSTRVLLEAAPAGLSPDDVGAALASEPGVVEVHDLHVWELTQGFPAVTAHVVVATGNDCHATRFRLQQRLERDFHVAHSTLQVDHDHRGELVQLEGAGDTAA
ncbi:MAG: cation diffusion facilitator family transporter [Solirubrobacteraceae bacterium]|nr:cation diffusion facilitator family transporter [Solirubrobacteraceae bacterium]